MTRTLTLTREVNPNCPPWRLVPRLGGDGVFLLDSALGSGSMGRWSFVGGRPAAMMTAKRRRGMTGDGGGSPFLITLTTWRHPDGRVEHEPVTRTWSGKPFVALRQLQAAYDVTGHSGDEPAGPFTGGLVGWFGYELAHALEDLPDRGRDDLGLPDLAFLVADEVLAVDHLTGRTTLSVTDRGDEAERFHWWEERLAVADPGPAPASSAVDLIIGTSCDRTSYGAKVARCVEHILDGDVFEVCLTHRLEAPLRGDPWRLYEILRQVNPAPFATWLAFPDHQVVSTSPERFLGLTPDGGAESRPIKGTAPRGFCPEEDAGLAEGLAGSEKDRAENLMIVDLVRNDFGKVCEVGSISVPEICKVESYATVHQLVSTIRGQLLPDRDALDLVAACFPGGSMTGAPKIAAMEIADRLEPVKRGVYSGALGYLDRGGAMDLSIVIRSIVCAGGRASLGVGGAVTADSDPGAEYDESLDKAKAMLDALGRLDAEVGPN